MKNDELVCQLLNFIRYKAGNIQIATSEKEWTNLTDWQPTEVKFATHDLGFSDYAQQITLLRNYIYTTFYVLGRADLHSTIYPPSPEPPLADTSLTIRPTIINEALPKKSLKNGQIIVERETSRFVINPGFFQVVPSEVFQPSVVKMFSLSARTNELEEKDGSWYWTDGTQPGFTTENQYIRFYFNPFPNQSEAVAHLLISYLDTYKVPFQLKYLAPDQFISRCDRIILYASQQHFVVVAWIVMRIYEICQKFLRDKLPLFVRPLTPLCGIGFAEDTFTTESFGESRCTWIASAVVKWASGLDSTTCEMPPVDRLIADIIAQQKIENLDNMHLNAGSFYPYNFDIFNYRYSSKLRKRPVCIYLQAAIDIANFLCREAVWLNVTSCIWIGATKDADSNPVYQPLTLEWESGSVGPALFLHMVGKYVDDPLYKFIIESMLPDLEGVLTTMDSSISSALLSLYNYYASSDFLSSRNLLMPILNVIDRQTINPVTTRLESILKAPHQVGFNNYKFLLSFLEQTEKKSVYRPLLFYKILKKIQHESLYYYTNAYGFDDFVPGMNGLTLIGFSYLLAYDSLFPAVPTGSL